MIVGVASSRIRILATVAFTAIALAGCRTIGATDTTGSISSTAQRSDADWRREGETLGEKFRANPRDADNAIRYAQALRATSQRTQAAAVLETAALHNPHNKALLGAYGRALADAGNLKQALDVLERAHSPDQPDWRILSVQGAVLDQMGRHGEAQRYYRALSRSCRTSLQYCPISGFPTRSPDLSARGNLAARLRQRQRSTSVCGRTSRCGRPPGRFAEAEGIARSVCRQRGLRECRISAPDVAQRRGSENSIRSRTVEGPSSRRRRFRRRIWRNLRATEGFAFAASCCYFGGVEVRDVSFSRSPHSSP